MEEWMEEAIEALGEALTTAVGGLAEDLAETIYSSMVSWFYEAIFGALSDFFEVMNNMGAEIFELSWVQATVLLFSYFGWALFAVGTVVAVFEVAVEYQNGGANIKGAALCILKGFFAVNLFTKLPIELYKFCITLQDTLSGDLIGLLSASKSSLSEMAETVMTSVFSGGTTTGLFTLLTLIAFAYCIVKVFFQNIKRGGILLTQICIGSLYMFSLPRGYDDGFNAWIKQIIAICFTAFLQTTLLFLGLLTFEDSMLLGLGIMLSAGEVPRIAQQFGLETSVKPNITSAIRTTSTIVTTASKVL